MRTFCASAVRWTTLTLLALCVTTPSLADVTDIAEKTLPKQRSPTTEYKGVIPPPFVDALTYGAAARSHNHISRVRTSLIEASKPLSTTPRRPLSLPST